MHVQNNRGVTFGFVYSQYAERHFTIQFNDTELQSELILSHFVLLGNVSYLLCMILQPFSTVFKSVELPDQSWKRKLHVFMRGNALCHS